MEEFLVSPYFRFGIFPVGSAILGIAIKYVTRNDQYSSFAKEDLAIGLELMRTACLMFVVLTTDKALELIKTNKEMARDGYDALMRGKEKVVSGFMNKAQ